MRVKRIVEELDTDEKVIAVATLTDGRKMELIDTSGEFMIITLGEEKYKMNYIEIFNEVLEYKALAKTLQEMEEKK